jgi:hypothetical protein
MNDHKKCGECVNAEKPDTHHECVMCIIEYMRSGKKVNWRQIDE